MARVLAQQWISADGFVAGPGGEGDIFAAVTDAAATEAHNRALLPRFGEVLLGRHTYELFAAFWPYADDQPMAATVNAMRRTVASGTLGAAPWGSHAPATVVPDAAAHVRAARADVIVWGSLRLMQSLLRDGCSPRSSSSSRRSSSARAGRCSPRAGPARACASTSSRASRTPRASSGCATPCGPDAVRRSDAGTPGSSGLTTSSSELRGNAWCAGPHGGHALRRAGQGVQASVPGGTVRVVVGRTAAGERAPAHHHRVGRSAGDGPMTDEHSG